MKTIFTLIFFCAAILAIGQEVIFEQPLSVDELGSAPDGSAIVDMKSTTKGMLVPRMTSLQRTDISSPATGLLVYDTDEKTLYCFDGTSWSKDADRDEMNELQTLSILGSDLSLSGGNTITIPAGKWSDGTGSSIHYSVGSVGVGTSNPAASIDIAESTKSTALNINHSDNNSPSFSLSLVKSYGGTGTAQGIRSNVVANSANSSAGIYSYLDAGATGTHRSIDASVQGAGTAIYGKAFDPTGMAAELDGDVDIIGQTDIDGDLIMSSGVAKISFVEGATEKSYIYYTGNNLLIDNSEVGSDIQMSATDDFLIDVGDDIFLETDGTTRMFISNLGKIGIGTSGPSSFLEIRNTEINGTSELVDFTTTDTITSNNDLLNLSMGSSSADNAQFIECNRGGTKFQVNGNGSTAIGSSTHAAGYMLSVDGKVICEELQIELKTNWPDYVFEDDYQLNHWKKHPILLTKMVTFRAFLQLKLSTKKALQLVTCKNE